MGIIKNNIMTTLAELRDYFKGTETKSLSNDVANYQFVKRQEGEMFQFSNGEYKFYRTFEGFIKACLWRIKRG